MATIGETESKKTENVGGGTIQSKPDRRLSMSSKRPENADQRNFRSQYYEKVGFRTSDYRSWLKKTFLANAFAVVSLPPIQEFHL